MHKEFLVGGLPLEAVGKGIDKGHCRYFVFVVGEHFLVDMSNS